MSPQKEVLDLEFHPLANLFPLTEGEAFEELVRDIKENGLQNPIILWEDKILDGRNRHRAVKRILASGHKIKLPGGETVYKDFYEQFRQYRKTSKGSAKIEPTQDDALRFVLSTNLHRRHLTDSQRAAIAADIANLGHGGDRSKSPVGDLNGNGEKSGAVVSQSDAAKMLNTSKRSVERAAKRKKLDPAAHEAAKAGQKAPRKPKAKAEAPDPNPAPDFDFLTDDKTQPQTYDYDAWKKTQVWAEAKQFSDAILKWDKNDPAFAVALQLVEGAISQRKSAAETGKPEPNPATDFDFLTDDNFKLKDSRDIAHQVVELMCSISMSCHYYMDSLDIIEEKLGKMRVGNFSDSRKGQEVAR